MEIFKILLQNDPRIQIIDDPGHPGERCISCNVKGYRVSRLINGKPCSCTTVWALANGNCSCASNDSSNPVVLVVEE